MDLFNDSDYDTDIDDEETEIDVCQFSRLSFDEKLSAHHINRLDETFRQIHVPFYGSEKIKDEEMNHENLISLRCTTLSNQEKVEIYEKCCQVLDITSDWQIRQYLLQDNVSISDRSFSFNDIRAFATVIDANLETLVLHSIGLTTSSTNVLCLGLKNCVHLTLLDLSDNQKIGRKGFESIVNVVNQLSSLHYLSLANCDIQDSYAPRIRDLCQHKSLIELDLSGNKFEEQACIFIGNALVSNIKLSYFNISWNLIRSQASISLFRGIEVNQALTDLDVSRSGLGYDGSVALRRVLSVNKSLKILNISHCNIDWRCIKLISAGLKKNSTLAFLNVSYNPITTHGIHRVIEALQEKASVVSTLDLSGMSVHAASMKLAEKIKRERNFTIKYDHDTSVHDFLGRQIATKGESMRKIIHHINKKHWRTLEYFRMLDTRNKQALNTKRVTFDIAKSGVKLENEDVENVRRRLTQRSVQPLTYKNLNAIINQQKMRDRSLKARQEKQLNDLKKRNQKILLTVKHHFPDIEVISKYEKHKEAIEKLAKPRINMTSR